MEIDVTQNNCPECKEPLMETDKFCPNCGLNLEDDFVEYSGKRKELRESIEKGRNGIRIFLILSIIGLIVTLLSRSSIDKMGPYTYLVTIIAASVYTLVFGLLLRLSNNRPYEAMLIATILMGISMVIEILLLQIISALISFVFISYFVKGLKAASRLRDLESARR